MAKSSPDLEVSSPSPRSRLSPRVNRIFAPIQLVFTCMVMTVPLWAGDITLELTTSTLLILIFTGISIAFCIAEAIIIAFSKLDTRTYLSFQIAKTTLWLVAFIMIFLSIPWASFSSVTGLKGVDPLEQPTQTYDQHLVLVVALALTATSIVSITLLVSLICASIIHHRYRLAQRCPKSTVSPTDSTDTRDATDAVESPACTCEPPSYSSHAMEYFPEGKLSATYVPGVVVSRWSAGS